MKVTKDYLKRVIKEELEKMEEAEVAFSDPGHRPQGSEHGTSGPEAPGDVVAQAMYDARFQIEHMLDYMPEKYLKGLSPAMLIRLREVAEKLKEAEQALKDSRFGKR